MSALDIKGLVQPDRVHRAVYTDPAIFELEMERLFARAWLLDAALTVDPPQAAFVAGELTELLSAEQRAIRAAARHPWRAACKKRLR